MPLWKHFNKNTTSNLDENGCRSLIKPFLFYFKPLSIVYKKNTLSFQDCLPICVVCCLPLVIAYVMYTKNPSTELQN